MSDFKEQAVSVQDQIAKQALDIRDFGAIGDGINNDTNAFLNAITLAQSLLASSSARSVKIFIPSGTYLINQVLSLTTPGMIIEGESFAPYGGTTIVQQTYGLPIFDITADRITVKNIHGTYSATTTLNQPGGLNAGSTTITVQSIGQMLVGDTIIINEYPNHEQFSINAINGNVITLGVSGNPTTTTTTSLNHANQVPVRCQAEVIGSMYGDPLRDYAAFANIVTASNCLIENCSVFAMVVGVKLRGRPLNNIQNDHNNTVKNFHADSVAFGCLIKQQNNAKVNNLRVENLTFSQDGHVAGAGSAPSHAIYSTGPIHAPSNWSSSTTYSKYSQVTYNNNYYISSNDNNINAQPDISPLSWILQSQWQTVNNNLSIDNVYCNANQVGNDCSGIKVKFVNGALVSNIILENCVRGFDLEQFNNSSLNHFVVKSLIASASADSQASVVNLLNSNYTNISEGIINVMTSSNAGIDIPAFLARIDSTNVANDIHVLNIQAYTNYSSSYTSNAACFKTQGGRRNNFINCKVYDNGSATGWYPFGFYQNTATAMPTINGASNTSPVVITTSTPHGLINSQRITPANFVGNTAPNIVNLSNITGVTNASPVVITTSTAHGLISGQQVTGSGFLGNTSPNTTFYVNVLSSNTFACYSDSALTTAIAGNGTWTSGGTITTMCFASVLTSTTFALYLNPGLSIPVIGNGVFVSGNGESITAYQASDFSSVINPSVYGPIKFVNIASGNNGVVLSFDPNMLPAGYTVNDNGSGTLRNDKIAALSLLPTSISADVLSGTSPLGATYKWINLKNKNGNTEFSVKTGVGTGLVIQGLSSDSASPNGGSIALGTSVDGGYFASGKTFGSVYFVQNASSSSSAPGLFAVTAELGSSSSLGADLVFKVGLSGQVSPTSAISMRLYSNGDVRLGATGVALATNATSGFVHIPNMAGLPSGSVTGYTGNTPIAWDSTNKVLWVNTGSSNWKTVDADTCTSNPTTGATLIPGLYIFSSSANGNSYFFDNPASWKGKTIRIKWTYNTDATKSITLQGLSGATVIENLSGALSSSFSVTTQTGIGKYINWESNGTNWYIVGNN